LSSSNDPNFGKKQQLLQLIQLLQTRIAHQLQMEGDTPATQQHQQQLATIIAQLQKLQQQQPQPQTQSINPVSSQPLVQYQPQQSQPQLQLQQQQQQQQQQRPVTMTSQPTSNSTNPQLVSMVAQILQQQQQQQQQQPQSSNGNTNNNNNNNNNHPHLLELLQKQQAQLVVQHPQQLLSSNDQKKQETKFVPLPTSLSLFLLVFASFLSFFVCSCSFLPFFFQKLILKISCKWTTPDRNLTKKASFSSRFQLETWPRCTL
jgi:hypothetical protein